MNLLMHASTWDHSGRGFPAPPHRTGHADFPHPAHRQSLAIRHAQGVEDAPALQIDKPIAFQPAIQAFTLSKWPAPPLAPVSQKSLKPTAYEMIDVTEYLSWIAIAKIVSPPPENHIHLGDHFNERLLISTTALPSYLLPEPLDRLFRRKDVQILVLPSSKVPVIAVGVGIGVTPDPLHRSQRAELPHWAPTLGCDVLAQSRNKDDRFSDGVTIGI